MKTADIKQGAKELKTILQLAKTNFLKADKLYSEFCKKYSENQQEDIFVFSGYDKQVLEEVF